MELDIEKLVYGGDGLARLPADEHGRGKALFVPFVLQGERVETTVVEEKPGFSRGHLDRVLAPSPQRIAAVCPYFTRCGGCHYQHSDYKHQLEIKTAILKENLRRIAKLELQSELEVHPSPPWNYRNRTRLRVRTQPQFALGYNRFASHELEPVEECPISSPLINRAIAALWEFGRAGRMNSEVREIELFADANDAQLLLEVFVGAGNNVAEALATELMNAVPATAGVAVLNQSEHKAPQIIAAAGATFLEYTTKNATYRVSAGAFFQVNRFLTDELVRLVTQSRSGGTALDLYAGVGLFSTVLSREFERVMAVESSPQSAADLGYNSPGNVKAVRATVEEYVRKRDRGLRADLIVVDPPRGGLGTKLARAIGEWQAPRLTYVSCDPATLARDLVPLLAVGYRVEHVHLVDLFPQTFHLESVVELNKNS